METCKNCGKQYFANTGHPPEDCFIPPRYFKCEDCGGLFYEGEHTWRDCAACKIIVNDTKIKDTEWIRVMQDLYSDLRELTKGEECDHPVNICWCNVFDHLRKAKEMLNKVGANI